jgi:hypothetical protein
MRRVWYWSAALVMLAAAIPIERVKEILGKK